MSLNFRKFKTYNPNTKKYEDAIALETEPSPERVKPIVEEVFEEHKTEFVTPTVMETYVTEKLAEIPFAEGSEF